MNPTIEDILRAWLEGKTVIEYTYNSQRNEFVFNRYCTPGTEIYLNDTRWYEYEISNEAPENNICKSTFVVDGLFVYLTDKGTLTQDSVEAKAFKTKEEAAEFIKKSLPETIVNGFVVTTREIMLDDDNEREYYKSVYGEVPTWYKKQIYDAKEHTSYQGNDKDYYASGVSSGIKDFCRIIFAHYRVNHDESEMTELFDKLGVNIKDAFNSKEDLDLSIFSDGYSLGIDRAGSMILHAFERKGKLQDIVDLYNKLDIVLDACEYDGNFQDGKLD